VWDTDFGELKLQINGNLVSGTYSPHNGHITGTMTGNVVQGTWRQDAADRSGSTNGTFSLIFGADGQSFSGRWNYTDKYAGGGGNWIGRRLAK